MGSDMSVFSTGHWNALLTSKDELRFVPPPLPGLVHIVTKFRLINHGTASITPKVRVKTTDQAKIDAGMEYVPMLPTRAIAAGGMIDEDRPPIVALGFTESLWIELAAEPSTDPEKQPSILVVWLAQPEV